MIDEIKQKEKPEAKATVTLHASSTFFSEFSLEGASGAPLTSRHLAGVCHFLLTEFQTCFQASNASPSPLPSLSPFYLLRLIGASCEPLAMEMNLERRTGKFRLTQIHTHKCTTDSEGEAGGGGVGVFGEFGVKEGDRSCVSITIFMLNKGDISKILTNYICDIIINPVWYLVGN